jgi:peroxiredoxin
MTIQSGDRLPDATFKTVTPDGAVNVSTGELFANKKVVLFGVPGAFTPTCSNNHLPGFLENADAIKARGVDTIAVVSVNDHHVMNAWAKASGNDERVVFLADGNADFAKAVGLDMDLSKGGLGTRYQRFSMIVDNGVVTALNVEDSPGKAEVSGAARILEQL